MSRAVGAANLGARADKASIKSNKCLFSTHFLSILPRAAFQTRARRNRLREGQAIRSIAYIRSVQSQHHDVCDVVLQCGDTPVR